MSSVVMLLHVFFNQNFQVSSDFPQVRPGSHPHNRIRLHETLHHVALSVFPLLLQCLSFLFSFLFFKWAKTGSPASVWKFYLVWSGCDRFVGFFCTTRTPSALCRTQEECRRYVRKPLSFIQAPFQTKKINSV